MLGSQPPSTRRRLHELDWLRRRRRSRTLPASCPTSTAPPAGACARDWPLRWPPAPARAATGASSRSRGSSPGCGWSTWAAARSACGLSSPTSTSRASTSRRARSTRGPFVQADATERLPFDDGAFDLAYSSSVVEHVAPARRAAFAAEVRRVARGWFVQTPAWSFPIEPARPAARRALAARRAAAPVLAPGRRGRVGGHRAAAPGRAGRPVRRAGPRRAPGRPGQELDRPAGDRYLERLIHSPPGCA